VDVVGRLMSVGDDVVLFVGAVGHLVGFENVVEWFAEVMG
jgi:uncharacterized protein YbaP (TraB family)